MQTEGKTIREQNSKKLIPLNDELAHYFSNNIIAQLFVDANLTLRKFSSRAQKIFKLTDEHINQHVDDIPEFIQFQDLKNNIQEVLETTQDREHELEARNGKIYQVNIAPYFIPNEEKVKGVIVTFIDVTERITYLKELERLNEDHESFIYSVSHDLREPLLNVVLLIQDLEDTHNELSGKMFDIMKRITASVNDMSEFILELTDLIRSEDDQEESRHLDFEDVLDDVLLVLKNRIAESEAVISTDIHVTDLYFPRKNLRCILYNLISNAIKYKHPDRPPEISVKTEMADEHVHITVRDNGIGMSEDQIEHLFTKFSRSPNDPKGLGVGLYIVKKMITNNGGKIEVVSTPGKGTTFYIYLKKEGQIKRRREY